MNYKYLCAANGIVARKCSLARQACVYNIFHCQQRTFKFKASKMAIKYIINATFNGVSKNIYHILKK